MKILIVNRSVVVNDTQETIERLQKKYPLEYDEIYTIVHEYEDLIGLVGAEWVVKLRMSGEIGKYGWHSEDEIMKAYEFFNKMRGDQSFKKLIQEQYPDKHYKNILGFSIEEINNIKKQLEKEKPESIPKPKTIYRNSPFEIIKITSIAEACEGSKGIWCTQQPDKAKSYLDKGSLFIVKKNGSRIAMLHPATREFKDKHNRVISLKDPIWEGRALELLRAAKQNA